MTLDYRACIYFDLAIFDADGEQVVGARGRQVLDIALTVEDQTYAFRDETGRPLWAGGRGKGSGGNQ